MNEIQSATHWTVDRLSRLPLEELDQMTRAVIRNLASSRVLLGRCLLALEADDRFGRLGFSGFLHYAIITAWTIARAAKPATLAA